MQRSLETLCKKGLEELPNGAHMEVGAYGDLDSMRWVQNGPWAPDTVEVNVAFGAPPSPICC